ncbi:hypothetical protein QUF54_03685 [Candidatus Marithioploca araucensis]|uniref:Uncharacterized protein n=1 Tax=Candidatus Marithioploca araucensis TaxID=70273 RepID=A0ABT7VRZ5_9GAMM|nr:hypothetical protein [Candidatus Marithioploca araucensis]
MGKVLFLPTFLIKKCRCTKKTLPTYMAFLMRKVGKKKTLPTLHGCVDLQDGGTCGLGGSCRYRDSC